MGRSMTIFYIRLSSLESWGGKLRTFYLGVRPCPNLHTALPKLILFLESFNHDQWNFRLFSRGGKKGRRWQPCLVAYVGAAKMALVILFYRSFWSAGRRPQLEVVGCCLVHRLARLNRNLIVIMLSRFRWKIGIRSKGIGQLLSIWFQIFIEILAASLRSGYEKVSISLANRCAKQQPTVGPEPSISTPERPLK